MTRFNMLNRRAELGPVLQCQHNVAQVWPITIQKINSLHGQALL